MGLAEMKGYLKNKKQPALFRRPQQVNPSYYNFQLIFPICNPHKRRRPLHISTYKEHYKDLAQQANVTFHYIPSETQRLSADHIAQNVQNSETRSLWLCGSRSFTNSIAEKFKTRSLHQELFEFR